jgi:hypothetical protein
MLTMAETIGPAGKPGGLLEAQGAWTIRGDD